MFEKKVSREDFNEVRNDLWKLQEKFNDVCKLLGIGFRADTYEPDACYIDKDRSAGIKKS